MRAKLFYFSPTTVKYSALTGSWALIELDNTACSTDFIFHMGTTGEKYSRRHCWGDAVLFSVWREVPGFAQISLAGLSGAVPMRAGAVLQPGRWQELPPLAQPPALRSLLLGSSSFGNIQGAVPASRSHFDCRADLHLGGAWLEVSWAQSLCWGFETEQGPLVSFKH